MTKERENNITDFLRIREEYSELIFRNSKEGIIIIQDEKLVYADPQVLDFLDISREEMAGRRFFEFIYPDDLEKVKAIHKRRMAGENNIEKYLFRIFSPGGGYEDLETTGFLIEWEGRPASLNMLTKVTKRMEAEAIIRESERKFRSLYGKMIEATVEVDIDGRITDMNHAFEKLLSYGRDELIGSVLKDLVHADWKEEDRKHYEQALSKGYCDLYELDLTDKQGLPIPVEIRCYLREDERSRPEGCWYFIRDIRMRKQYQDVLKESEKKLKTVLEYFPAPIILIDLSFIYDYLSSISVNRDTDPETFFRSSPDEFARCLGNIKAKYVNKEAFQFFSINSMAEIEDKLFDSRNADMSELIMDVIQKAWLKEGDYEKEVSFDIGPDHTRTAVFKSVILPGNENSWETVLVSITDLSEKKKTIKQLEEAKNKAEESDRLKTAFLANMSHEIRTPMNAIVGFSELLRTTDAQGPDRAEYFSIINNSCNTLSKLIDDIIDLAKIEAGQTTIVDDACRLYDLMKELQRYFEEEVKRSGKAMKIIMDSSIDPDLSIRVDEFRLRQVISNIIANAVKFTEKGFIFWGCDIIKNRELRFHIKDTGIGIDQDKTDLIFDRFRQMDGSSVRKYGGTGLGLPVSKSLVTLMGGELWVKSQPGSGSEFFFTIPYKKMTKPEPEHEAEAVVNNVEEYDFRNKGVLVVEDNLSNYEFIKAVLSRTKVKLYWADDGAKALEMFRKKKRHLNAVLMDIQIPEMNGYETTRLMKKIDQDIPVIAQTAFAMSRDKEKSLDAGCDDYIPKPIKPTDLLDMLAKYL